MGELFTEAQVEALWVEWRDKRDLAVRDKLIGYYLPRVEFLAARLASHVPESYRQDLLGFGAMGLMDALEKFRPELGNRFETYGSCRIRGAMSDGIRSLEWLPRGAGARPSRVIEKVVPVDFQTARTRVGSRLEESLFDPLQQTPWDAIELQSDYGEVVKAIELLPERERTVITAYYYAGRRLADIAVEFGVTESRVCQIHRRALQLLEIALSQRLTA